MSVAAMDSAAPAAAGLTERLAAAWQAVTAAQQGRSFLWCAPALAAGSAIYFSLPLEPPMAVAALALLLGMLALWRSGTVAVLLLTGMMGLGFGLAKVQTESVATPLLAASTGEVTVTGRVVSASSASRNRLVMILEPKAIEGLAAEKLPVRLRLSLPEKAGTPVAGSEVSFRARLMPLPSPIEPGGFDYGRSLWFESIGGTGRVTSAVSVLKDDIPLLWRFDGWLADIRAAMGVRIRAALEEPYASFAEALITGERSSIPPEINHSLMVSGLYHILSISGLHMWLVAGGVFWAVRAALALAPGLALGWPIRKWAAAAALLMALFYMLLADSGVATTRSFVMVAIVFFAIMVDRPALSMRNLALAALAILLIDPGAVTEAGFQMSFLAVLGLVAFYEAWATYRAAQPAEEAGGGWPRRLAAWALAAIAVSLLTSLVAGFASSLPAAYHFGRISPYGVIANGLAIPVVGVVVMPAALAVALLMPLGLEWLPLQVMGKGLELVVMISDAIAGLPGADEVVARPPVIAAIAAAAGLIGLCLLAGPVRLAGLGLMVLGGLLALVPPAGPDLLIEASGRNVALRDAANELVPAQARRGRFAVEKWLQSNGEEAELAEAVKRPGWTCAEGVCRATVKGRRVAYISGREGEALDCRETDILIADFPLRGACPEVSLRIDRFDLWRQGAHALTLGPEGHAVATARGLQGERPWRVVPEARARAFATRPPEEDNSRD
jgi:competence protein ComEC